MNTKDIVKLTPEEIEKKWATTDYHDYKKSHYHPELDWMKGDERTPEDLLLEQEDEQQEDEVLQEVRETINALTEQQQRVITLLYDDNLSHREVAEKLNISHGRVDQLHQQALKKMKRVLDKEKDLLEINGL